MRSASARTAAVSSLRGDRHIADRLRVALEHRGRLAERAAVQGGAEKERSGEPVASDVAFEIDDVTGLLAAEHAALARERLQHVTVTDVGRDDAHAVLGHERVEAEVRHRA